MRLKYKAKNDETVVEELEVAVGEGEFLGVTIKELLLSLWILL